MGQRQQAIKHNLNCLQIFSNSLQSVFRKRQTELFIIHSDKEMLSVLADIWKDINNKRPSIFQSEEWEFVRNPQSSQEPPCYFFSLISGTGTLLLINFKKNQNNNNQKGLKTEHKSTCRQEKCISCCFSK